MAEETLTSGSAPDFSGEGRTPDNPGRKRSRKFRLCMKKLLALPVSDESARDELLALGLKAGEADNYMLVALTVFKKAVGGDLKFIQELRQIVSDNETEIDRKTGIAQLDKIKAQTEEIRHKFSDSDNDNGQYMAEWFDVLRKSAESMGDGGLSGTPDEQQERR